MRKQMRKQESHQDERLAELRVMLQDDLKLQARDIHSFYCCKVLTNWWQVADHLEASVRRMVKEGIARRVKDRVAAEVGL